MRLKSSLCLLSLAVTFFFTVTQYSCTDPLDDQPEEKDKQEEKQDSTTHQQDSIIHQQDSVPEQHDIYKNIAAYLEYSLEGELSDFAAIVKKTGLWDSMSGSDIYTCFAPTNDALRYYLQDKAMNQSIQALPDSVCGIIAKRHLIKAAIYLHDLKEDHGTLPAPNLLNEYLNYTINCDTIDMGEGEFTCLKMYLLNDINDTINITRVIMLDDTVGNGVVHVIDHVIDYTRK